MASPYVTLHQTLYARSINALHTHSLDIYQNCNLLHLRLDHNSNKKLFELNKTFPFIKYVTSASPWDIFYAMQKWLPFYHSFHVSVELKTSHTRMGELYGLENEILKNIRNKIIVQKHFWKTWQQKFKRVRGRRRTPKFI